MLDTEDVKVLNEAIGRHPLVQLFSDKAEASRVAIQQSLESSLLYRLESEARIAVLTARIVKPVDLGQFERDVRDAVAAEKEQFLEDAMAELKTSGVSEAEVQASLARLTTVLA